MVHAIGTGRDDRERASPRVLLVDDDLEFLAAMKEQLEAECSAVYIAQTPLAALWLLERVPIDAVVCDLALGGIDGRYLLEQLRERYPQIARVLITGFSERVPDEKTFWAAQSVLLKPCDATSLSTVLRELAAN
jgi:CheY-like chemotaxis protein